MSFKEHFGYEDTLIPKLATGLGAGIGRKGSLCGNFTGSVVVIGMKFGRRTPKDQESKEKVYKECSRFWERFEEEFGSTLCYDLIGAHLDHEEERQKWLASGGLERCSKIVEKTAQMLCEFMKRT